MLDSLWDNGVAGAGAVALILGAWLTAKGVGLLDRPKYTLQCAYLPPQDLLGFFTMPHFVVEYENDGNVPVTFSDFELVRPRFEKITAKGEFKLHLGAELFIDKRRTATIGPIQHLRAIDYRTNKVRLEPGDSHSDFFDLGAFLDDADPNEPLKIANVPSDFRPVLTFRDSFGHRYHCDEHGVHAGRYESPMAADLRAAGVRSTNAPELTTRRRLLRGLGWSFSHSPSGETPHDPTR